MKSPVNYQSAGVSITAGNTAVSRIRTQVESTFSPAVLGGIGGFGALYDLSTILQQYQHPVLVQSMDGVGTKIMIARRMNRYDTIGIDLVSATANDIVVLGAKPLTLLDYIANDCLNPDIVVEIIAGMTAACRENNISLTGGEMAEMPGVYAPGEHDLAGVITGIVERDSIIDGSRIVPGDILMAFSSNGLHTNGYSLARQLCFENNRYEVDSIVNGMSLGELLLTPHLNYTKPVQYLLQHFIEIRGMAHITGGGLLDNIPRMLPAGCRAEVEKGSWPELFIFDFLQTLGNLSETEMYRTFNMGVGLVMAVSPDSVAAAQEAMKNFPGFSLHVIGRVGKGEGRECALKNPG